jgi:hypothetical protein
MSFETYDSYRGYSIRVWVTAASSLSLHGVGRRYKVSWIVTRSEHPGEKVASFPERLEFLSEHEALTYAENRAHTFIDCMLSEHRRMPLSGEVGHSREPSLDPDG